MNVLSLFTGVGGIDLGLERAGHRIVGQCEADPAARRVLERHWPDTPLSEDVGTLDREWLDRHGIRAEPAGRSAGTGNEADNIRVDLVAGGFPCQDLSVAGKRAGLAGERSGLFHEATRVADLVLQPGGWLLIENVPGLFSSNNGRDFGIVLASLADLGFHDLAWRVLDSRYFGVPQRRRRVFILARRARGDRAKQVLLEPESGGGDFAAGSETGPRVAETLTRGSSKPGVSALGRRQEDDVNIVAPTLRANGLGGGRYDKHPMVTASALDRQAGGPDDNSAQGNHLVAGPLTHRYGKGVNTTMDDGAMVVGGLTRRYGKGTDSDATDGMAVEPGGVRRLAPVECERLQGFPDGWTIPDGTDWREHPKPDGPRYAQMGNAVTVPVAEWIGHRLLAAAGKDGE